MSVADRLAALTPEQRALFEKLREKQRQATRILQPPPIRRVSGPTAEGDWPLSLDQERYWFMEQLYPSGAGLNITAATRMRGALSPEHLAAGLSEIARRHAAWRTAFPAVDGRPVQRVGPPRPQRLPVIDLGGLPAERREPEALGLVNEDSAAAFDLERGPLVRSSLVRLSGGDHVCMLTVHHTVTDWLSFQIAWAELAALYAAFAAGGTPALPEPPVHYPDFAVWQREWLQGEVLDGLTSWWRERLAGFPVTVDLPADRPRPAVFRMHGGRLPVAVPRELADGLRRLAQQEGATLFMVVLAAVAALLHRDSGQERLILGANNANRNRPEIEAVLGCFLTQVPFAIDLAGDPSFRELLARVRQSALGSYAHQDLPFGQLVQALQLERDPSRQPLIQTLVQVLGGQASAARFAGASFEPVDAYDGRARYDLMLTLYDDPGGLAGSLEFDADLFDTATTARRIDRLLLQVAAAVGDPEIRLSLLPVLPAAARHQMAGEWNDTARPRPVWTAPQRFAEQAARTPQAVAAVAGGEELTYGELDRRSAELAHRLRGLGIGTESRVALLLDRTLDVPVAIFGVWKAGGAYVPLDPDSPAARLADLLADADPAVVIHRGAPPVPPAPGMRFLDLAAQEPIAATAASLPEARPEHLAYFIYTSGTTGRPKAVMVEHGSLAATLASFIERFSLGPGARIPHLSRYTFDASFLDLVAPLLAGGTVELLGRDELLDPDRLLLAFERATTVFTVPSLVRGVIASARERGPERTAGPRAIAIGGEAVAPELQADLLDAFPSTDLDIVYGPTETTVICAVHRVPRSRRPERALIGRPLPEVEARVVDPAGALVALGLPGELWIGGPGVARGYFRRAELTAERFVEADGRRFYRTGDLVRQVSAEGGALEFLGRTDFQVKVRGFRIEPGEVEAALLAHPAVREAVVVAHPGAGGDNQLVAYWVAAGGAAPPAEDLRAFLAEVLPDYMVPAIFVPLAALPLNPNGKVDRRALPAPAAAREDLAGSAPPRNAREELLAGIWREVLGVAQVGIHDNFFQLGGDSILSIQVVARARKAGLLLTTRQFFDNQTIAGLAAVAEAAAGAGEGSVTGEASLNRAALDGVLGDDRDVEDLYPLAPLQEGILFHSLYSADGDLYLEQLTAALEGPFDAAAFTAAWQRVVERHTALRTAFLVHGVERPLQLVRRSAELPWTMADWRGLPPAALATCWRDLLAADRARGFDLARPPLMRLTLVRTGEDRHRLAWTSHHLILDGWCFSLLLREVFTLYQAAVAGGTAQLPPPRPYRDYIAWLAQRDEAVAERYWQRALAGFAAPTPVPFDRPAALSGAHGSRPEDYFERKISLPAPQVRTLEALAQRLQVTVNTLAQGAWALLLSHYAQESDVVFGAVVSGRPAELPGVESMVGLFINTLPVRVAIPEGEAASTWLARLQASQFEQHQHQWTPLARIQALAGLSAGEPLFASLLVFENYPLDAAVSEQRLGELRIGNVELSERTNYPLTLAVVTRGDLTLRLTADRRFEPATVWRMLAHLEGLLGALAADPERPPRSLPLLTPAERHQMTAAWNDTASPLPGWTVPARVSQQAARTPGATAVVAAGESLTYSELDRRSDELARRLLALGVSGSARVALLLGRTADFPVAILAVWKAGGAFVPLDLTTPAERLASLLDDADPTVVIHRGFLPVELPAGACSLDLAALAPLPSKGEPEPLRSWPDRADLAYLIYTSGTTGRPKAVMIEHGSLAMVLGTILDRFAFRDDDRMLHLARLSFDISLVEVFAPLLAGGACEILPDDEVLDPERLLNALERATRVHAVPSLMRQIVEGARRRGPQRLSRLRGLLTGGDVVPPDLLADLRATFPGSEIAVLYGPTEATIVCAGYRLSRTPEAPLLGWPLDNVELRVVDLAGALVPLGVPGELWVGGPGVARGYFRREELTAEKLVVVDGRRFYRTGDLVRHLPAQAGALEFLGRTDFQVKIRGFRIEPGEVEAALLAHPAVREAVVVARPGAGGHNQLVAYWVAVEGAAAAEELRAFLAGRLPEYMLPAVFVPLAALPLTPNGKVDRKALPAPGSARQALAGEAAPRTRREALLAGIWREVLGLDRVGIHDDFFQLGGDSILSIQVVARARRVGLLVTVRQLFDNQTIAGLAAVAEDAVALSAGEGPIEGAAPLTPIQRRFFAERRRQPWRFNQAVMLIPRERLAAAPLASALARLTEHHDALRLRFLREESGWRQIHAPASAARESAPLLEIDLAALPAAARARALDLAAEELQSGLDLAQGPLFTAALFRLGEADERLLLTAHHLIVDGVSWRLLLEDLTAVYRQLAAGAAAELPPKTTSWKRWAEHLADFARSAELAAELPYWLALPSAPPLPVDSATAGSAARAAASVELGAAETRALLNEAPEAYRTQINDLLLAALARAFAAWTGEGALLIDLEGHGREELFPGVDLSRTVGWFTTVFPVALSLPSGAGPREAILAVKETLRAVPRRGLGFGLLRFLGDEETAERLAALPPPQVSFNYLGRFDAAAGERGLFAFAPEVARGAGGEAIPDRHLFQIDLLVLEDRLRVHWTYDPARHRAATAERLARGFLAEIETLVAHCLSPEAGGFTPSDFPLARLGQAALGRLLGNDRGVEDLYPLAPLQEGILFHSLYSGEADLYLEQFNASLAGPFDAAAFAAAWQRVVERHTALRTAFLVRGVERPLQLVRRSAELPWTLEDWRGLPPAAVEARWRELLAADRARGFDLARPPLMRLALVRTGDDRHRLVWTAHHLIFDGWCFSLLLSEVFTLYQAAVAGRAAELPPPHPYRDYIAWLAQRDEAEAERYWWQVLRGFGAPTPLPFDRPAALRGAHGSRPEDYYERKLTLPAPQVAALEALAQRLQVTLNTLVQGAWALLLSRYAQAADVVFGAVVSGRPAELPGVESMVGLFINTLPVRVEIPDGGAASDWLVRLQAGQFAQRQYQWTPLTRIQALAGLSAGEPLFASLLVFENYPVDASVSERLGELRLDEVELGERTNYPLTLTVVARGDLVLRLIADRRFEPATVRRLLAHLAHLLEAFAADAGMPPRSLPLLTPAERHQLTVDWSGAPPRHPRAATIHGLFAAQAVRAPDAVAVVCRGEELTYGALAARSGRLAGRLLRLGLPPESRIAIVAERSPALIVGLLGILQAGGAYLPLDPELPFERLAFLLADAGATVLLAGRETLASLPPGLRLDGVRVLALDDEEERDETPLLPEVAATDLAYVLYTSGSTGTPKGVAVPHRGVVRLVAGADWADLGPGETFLQLVHLTFDVSAFEIWAPLLNGGRLALYPGRRPDLDELAEVIARHGVTTLWLTSGLFHQMVHERIEGLRPLRQLVAGGDVLSPAHVRRALAGLPGCTLIDGYGPTENSVLTTSHAMTAADLEDERLEATVPIGRALRGTEVYVLGADLRPLPVGVWGELVAGGDGVARCYLGRPALTAESFIPDPFAGEPGARLYHTGDVVRWRPDGVLEFLGRRDGQVKVRGIRIELGEIEAALALHPAVRAAAVVPREDPSGDRRLIAYVAADPEDAPGPAALRRHLASRLPEPMLPAAFVTLERLPLTPAGKVDRRALPAPDHIGRPEREYVPPASPVEEQLAAVCAEVLGRERVGMEDNFFELGGHSLLATQWVVRLRDRYGLEVSLQMVFETSSLRQLADRIVEEELARADSGELAELMAELEELS